MRLPKPIVKIAVLSGFVILLTGFVAYRSGAFDSYLQKEEPAIYPYEKLLAFNISDTNKKPTIDTLIQPRTLMSSSKSLILVEEKKIARVYIDTSTSTKYNPNLPKETHRMWSSKSGAVIRTSDLEVPPKLKLEPAGIDNKPFTHKQIDSIFRVPRADSLRIVPLDTTKKDSPKMYGTKSGMIFRSSDIKPAKKTNKKKKAKSNSQ